VQTFQSMLLVVYLFFIDVLKIDNLWQFTKLTKLQLDNNIVEKIEGLDCLVNLRWLGKYHDVPPYEFDVFFDDNI